MASRVALHVLISVSVAVCILGIADGQTVQPSLSTTYYNATCPSVTSIVDGVVAGAIQQSRNVVGGLLRLHFHDCFVRGCDASVLIDSLPGRPAEKDGPGNAQSLRGFEVIDSVKTALDQACPGIVSCADILALVALSAVTQIGGPSWRLPLGRRDGFTSNAAETSTNLPSLTALYAELKDVFASKGLNEQDLVALSGAHTIGNTHCSKLESRLYNSTGPGGVDPTLDPTYAAQLIAQCPYSRGRSLTVVPMDPTLGGDTFDSNYYTNVLSNRSLFIADATLSSTANGARLVTKHSSNAQFYADFALAMTKMAGISVLLAPQGEIRQNCHVVNSSPGSTTPSPAAAAGPPPTPASTATPPTVTAAPPPPPTRTAPPVATPTPAPSPPPRAPAPSAPTSPPAFSQRPTAPTTVATTPPPPASSRTPPAPAPLTSPPAVPTAPSPPPPPPSPAVPNSRVTPPATSPIAKTPPPPSTFSKSAPPPPPVAVKSPAPSPSSGSRTRSGPRPIYYLLIHVAGVFIGLLHILLP